MSKQISAVEWYENRIFILQIQLEKKEISLGEYSVTRVELFKQAKAMEKEQIIDFVKKFSDFNGITFNEKMVSKEYLEKFYNETFKSE